MAETWLIFAKRNLLSALRRAESLLCVLLGGVISPQKTFWCFSGFGIVYMLRSFQNMKQWCDRKQRVLVERRRQFQSPLTTESCVSPLVSALRDGHSRRKISCLSISSYFPGPMEKNYENILLSPMSQKTFKPSSCRLRLRVTCALRFQARCLLEAVW